MNSGVSSIEITNSEAVKLTFTKISSEGDVYSQEPLSVESGSGTEFYSGAVHKIEFVSYDVDHYSTLESWMNSELEVTAKVFGNDVNAVWDELAPIMVKKLIETITGKLFAFVVTIEIKGEYPNIVSVSKYNWVDGNGNSFVEDIATGTKIIFYKR